jgi:hypothetical protein
VRCLVANLDAVDKRGEPMYSVRTNSAELLLKYGIELHRDDAKARAAEAAGAAGPTQAVQFVVNLGSGPPPPPR